MQSFHPTLRTNGAALLVTMAGLLIVTIMVVTYSVVVRMETTTARSSFEAERAKLFSTMAVDEVVTKLRENIPTDTQWAAGPGRIYTYDTTQTPKPWRLTKLYSGTPTTGDAVWKSVALNGPSLSTPSSYPILSPNTEHPTPDRMVVSWIEVLQDGTRSTDTNFAAKLSGSNPIVGRYAYWVDTETSKVNLNTAGLAKTSYAFDSVTATGDVQNLSAHPSRVDLSKLDNYGGAISSANSLATFNYTDSGYWNEDTAPTATPAQRSADSGKKCFTSLSDWAVSGNTGIAPTQIEANKFNLTTLARSPELNPWGLNKWWWQSNAPQYPATPTKLGNRLNAPGLPAYSDNLYDSATPTKYIKGGGADPRYYVYPAAIGNVATATSTASKNMQWMGSSLNYHSSNLSPTTGFQDYITNMMTLLSRRDWPGMPARSFVDKYGIAACEDLAANMMYLYDSTVGAGGQALNQSDTTMGIYGQKVHTYTRPGGQPRALTGIGPWPYVNEVGVIFSGTQSGWTPATYEAVIPDPLGVTKSDYRPGFCKPVNETNYPGKSANYMNVQMDLYVEKYYPQNLTGFAPDGTRRGYNRDSNNYNGAFISIEIIATGTLNGAAVSYQGERYMWGRKDATYPNGTSSASGIRGRNYNWGPGGNAGGATWFTPSATPDARTYGSLYVGPFDTNTTPSITLKFRYASMKVNPWSDPMAIQIVPFGVDYGSNTPDDPNNPTKFVFKCDSLLLSELTLLPVVQSYEVADPRVYHYLSDWTFRSGNLINAPSGPTFGSLNKTYYDALGSGDDSKVAWPDVSAANVYSGSVFDPRRYQHSANTVQFPGIGWLSVLPTNTESSRNLDGTAAPKSPTPWKTLNFGPATDANELPDWLLLDVFAVAYNQTYLSQTQGKLNINATIAPFNFKRLAPLKALCIPSSQNATTNADTIATDVADCSGINSGPCSNLPSDMFVYSGQICQVASLQGSATKQFQQEAMIRDIAGLVTTQCSDFKVYVIAQSLVSRTDPNAMPKVTGEQRTITTVSRVVDVGPDEIPGTEDDMAGPDRVAGTGDDLTFKSSTGTTITKLKYDQSDPPLEGFAGRPPFRFQITKSEILTP